MRIDIMGSLLINVDYQDQMLPPVVLSEYIPSHLESRFIKIASAFLTPQAQK